MSIEHVNGLPLTLYVKAHYALLNQLIYGLLAFGLTLWFASQGEEFFSGTMEILATLVLLIFAANFVNFILRWFELRRGGRFTATAKITDVHKPSRLSRDQARIYTIEFLDSESIRREGTVKGEPWQKFPYETGDEITVLYDPLNPRDFINYSAYELLK